MADKPFRVLLDLTDLYIESLKYVWMNVSPQELKTIADLKTSVINKINLQKVDIRLFVRNGLLLDDETVMILREDDTVKVQYEDQYHSGYNHTENAVKENRKSSRKRNLSDSHSDLSLNAKRCKAVSKILTEEKEEIHFDEMSNKKKKKKQKKSHPICSENVFNQSATFEANNHNVLKIDRKKDENQITPLENNTTNFNSLQKYNSCFSLADQNNTVGKNENSASKADINILSNRHLKLNSSKGSLLISDFSLEKEEKLKKLCDINTETMKKSEGLGNNCPKKKRKRHRKRKQVSETVNIDACGNTDVNSEFKSFTNEDSEDIQRKHIVYLSSPNKQQEVIQLDCDDKNEKVKKLTTNTFVLDESVSNVSAEPSNKYPKISTPVQSNYWENPNWCFSLMQKTNLSSHSMENVGYKKEKNKTYDHKKSADEQSISFEGPKNIEKASEKHYTELPSLNSRPDIGAHIVYKILELDEHYSPVISDYREGIVKSINLDTEEMEIELLKHEIKPGRTGKFENLKENEIPLPEVKKCDTVIWSALVEPKLFC